ncbi:hypothetical protein [Lysobacter fragariae]
MAPTTVDELSPKTQAGIPWVLRVWKRMRREPSLLFTVAYVLVSFLGLWANFWFYRGFGLPILEYMQPSDYLVAGLRDPTYAALLAVSIVLTVFISGPDIYRRHHPQRVAEFRRRWWGRLVFPENRWLRWKGIGIAPETGVAFAVFWGMLWISAGYVQKLGDRVRADRAGTKVSVTLAGADSPLPQVARLLGTSSAFVFLWWPQSRVSEAIPIEGIARLQSVPVAPAALVHPVARDAGPSVVHPARVDAAATVSSTAETAADSSKTGTPGEIR